MPKGTYPWGYLHTPHQDKPIEEIYAAMDAYSHEFFEEETNFHSRVDFYLVLPPLKYEGAFVKGLFFSQGVDLIYKNQPEISKFFNSMAYSMSASIPWSKEADVCFHLYKNPKREEWFKKAYPDRADKILLPLEDSDFTNEYFLAPTLGHKKDIDVLTTSRLTSVKNLPIIAKAIQVYQAKYGQNIKLTCITGKDFGPDYSELTEQEMKVMKEIEQELGGNVEQYIDFVQKVNYKDMPEYYSRAKICVLGSLSEGKNRSIHEAMSCNTPVIVFEDFNKFLRGDSHTIPRGAGLYVPEYSAESLADTFHKALMNLDKFRARRAYLREYGRKNFANTCIDGIPYYAQNLPEYVKGRIQDNLWVDLAMQDNYQISFIDYLYNKKPGISHGKGLEGIDTLIKFFRGRLSI